MKLSDVPEPMIERFERGYVPMDAPPGLEEMAYKAWKDAGGTIKIGAVQPAGDTEEWFFDGSLRDVTGNTTGVVVRKNPAIDDGVIVSPPTLDFCLIGGGMTASVTELPLDGVERLARWLLEITERVKKQL